MTNCQKTKGFSRASTGSEQVKAALATRLQQVLDAGPAAIEHRLRELDGEWSAGRITKVVAGIVIGLGLLLAGLVHPAWLLLTLVGVLCLLQYLFSQYSTLGDLVCLFGFRPGQQIEAERLALRTFRGDFKQLPTLHEVEDQDAINRLEGEGGLVLEPEERKIDPAQAVREVLEATRR